MIDKDQASLNLDAALKQFKLSREFTQSEFGVFLAFLAAGHLATLSYKISEFEQVVEAMRHHFIQLSEELDT